MDGQSDQAQARVLPAPLEVLTLFTAGWLGGSGLLTALDSGLSGGLRLLAAAETLAAVLWFVPRLRMAGMGAMMMILVLAVGHHLLTGVYPGALVFYLAVVGYLAFEARRAP